MATAWSCSAPDAGLRRTVLPAIRLLSCPRTASIRSRSRTVACVAFALRDALVRPNGRTGEGSRDVFGPTRRWPSAEGRRIFFAAGVSDALPRVNGLAEIWGNGVPPTLMYGCELYRDGSASLVPILLGPPGSFLCPNEEAPCCFALWGECPFFHNHCMLSCSRGKSPAQLFRYLSAKWPAAFNPKAPRPLKIGIRHDIRMLDGELSDDE